jgi:peptide chain release factor 2
MIWRGKTMVQFEELRLHLLSFEEKLNELGEALGLSEMKAEVAALEEKTAQDGFWDDIANTQVVLQKIAALKNKISKYETLRSDFDDTITMIELSDEEEDLDMFEECQSSVNAVIAELDKQTLSTLLSGEYDSKNAVLTFHAGAGGTEAQDWNQMLVRMYTRWGEQHGFKVSMVDFLDGDEAGLKSAVLRIEGENAYGYMKSEAGVHRLVRVSPFDSSGRRHTSFASLEVMPEIDDTIEVNISPDDIKMEVYRASGAGGQKVNKTSSAVRLIHLPTNIVVSCQVERSQHQNREVAMRMLKSKLIEIKEREHLDKIEDIKGEQKEIGWGSQIRSYVFMPYTLAKDHRTGFEVGNINAVMDGEIDGFINAYLKQMSLSELNNN